jgi:nucleotide-binding universal stress UspA family protein
MNRSSIVCGLDGSSASCEALQVAHRLGERLGLRLVLAHVLPLPIIAAAPQVAFAADPRDLEIDGRAGRELLEQAARAADVGAEAARRVEFGDPAERLLVVAEEEGAEMIVVGSRRRGAWDAALHGSVPAALATRATRPVLVVPLGVAERSE